MDGTSLCLMKTIYVLFLLKWSVFAFSEFETTSSPSEITLSPSGRIACMINSITTVNMGNKMEIVGMKDIIMRWTNFQVKGDS